MDKLQQKTYCSHQVLISFEPIVFGIQVFMQFSFCILLLLFFALGFVLISLLISQGICYHFVGTYN